GQEPFGKLPMAPQYRDKSSSTPSRPTKVDHAVQSGQDTGSCDDPQSRGSGRIRPPNDQRPSASDLHRKAQDVVEQYSDRSLASVEITTKEALELIGHDRRGKGKGETIEIGIGE